MPSSGSERVMDENKEKEMMPFMDTFYSLASNDPSERNFAASSLIHHVFSSEEDAFEVTVKDGSYAMTRLLMGMCSGRASARQGMASCLATFFRISFETGPEDGSGRRWIHCFMEHMEAKEKESPLTFVRRKLIESTSLEAPKGKTIMKKSRADERDAHFGRLFGILVIARSGILNDKSISLDTLKSFVSDLVQLFHHKKWFREPAVHAMNEFFTSISFGANKEVLHDLVEVSLSKFFSEGVWSSEKIALYLLLQVLLRDSLPPVISKPLLTAANLSSNLGDDKMSVLLRDTSSTVYPRVHIVWKAIWSFICETKPNQIKMKNEKQIDNILTPRTKLPVGDESASDIVEALVQNVIIEQLLGNSTDGGINATHERRALALSLIHQMFQVQLPIDVIQNTVLQPTVVTNLFVHTLQKVTGNKGGDKNAPMHHTLQPLANRILEDVTDTFTAEKLDATRVSKRLSIVKALLHANPNFDNVTQTQTVSSLIGLENKTDDGFLQLWDEYCNFLIVETVECFKRSEPAFIEANKYIDTLYSFAKRLHKKNGANRISTKVLLFFLLAAFFDFSRYNYTAKSSGNTLFEVASMISSSVPIFPFEIRVTISSRFFSLLSECCVVTEKSDHIRDKKIETINSNVEEMFHAITEMENHHASLICQQDATDDDLPISRAIKIYKDLIEKVETYSASEVGFKNSLSAFISLASSLCIQLLNPGEPNEDDEELAEDEEDITEDILDILSDIADVINGIIGIDSEESDEEKGEVEGEKMEEEDIETSSNLLVSLATISVSLLNSSIGGSTSTHSVIRGGASKLVRDTISLTWSSALNIAGINTVGDLSLDAEVVNVLLASVCSEKVLAQGEEEIDDDEMDGDYDESDEDSDEDISMSFSKLAPGVIDDDSGCESSVESITLNEEISKNEDREEEIDPSRLENLLLQDSDDDDNEENILEHHEGADAALAQLIKMKQDARKGAQEKREKAELSNRLRCFSLLEAIYSSSKRTALLSNQAVLMPILPLLRSRTELHKSINSLSIEKKGSSIAEKRNLMEKITSLIENKICKINLDGTANIEGCKVLADQVIIEMKRAQNTDHSKCCSAILILINKAVLKHGADAIEFAKGIYDKCLLEWSTKKTTRLQAQMFEDFINKIQPLAHIILPAPLITASKNARSSFLQAEAFRLLSLLYQKPSTDYGSEELESLQIAVPEFIESLIGAFKDDALGKAKRVRELIKSTERLLSFSNDYDTEMMFDKMSDLSDSIKKYEANCSSTAITNTCSKLRDEIEKQVQAQKSKHTVKADDEVEKEQEKQNSKKKKNDKKKKKSKK
jgi:DNA polymerase phi